MIRFPALIDFLSRHKPPQFNLCSVLLFAEHSGPDLVLQERPSLKSSPLPVCYFVTMETTFLLDFQLV